jgi:hypothetical protein
VCCVLLAAVQQWLTTPPLLLSLLRFVSIACAVVGDQHSHVLAVCDIVVYVIIGLPHLIFFQLFRVTDREKSSSALFRAFLFSAISRAPLDVKFHTNFTL